MGHTLPKNCLLSKVLEER